MGFLKKLRDIDNRILNAADKAVPGGKQGFAKSGFAKKKEEEPKPTKAKRGNSTKEDYCNWCRHMATKCNKPCCVNVRNGFTEGGSHHKG